MLPSSKAPPASSSSYTWAADSKYQGLECRETNLKGLQLKSYYHTEYFTLNVSEVQFDAQLRVA